MKNQLLLLLSFFLLTSMAAHAVKVEGTVLDENKETVIGATVQLKGAAGVGTITDMDGKFVMQVPDVKEGVLIVSYIGYKTKHIPLRGRTILTVEMEPEVTALDEVVVVGYGSMRKSDLTGSVTSVKTNEAEAARATSFDKVLWYLPVVQLPADRSACVFVAQVPCVVITLHSMLWTEILSVIWGILWIRWLPVLLAAIPVCRSRIRWQLSVRRILRV